MNNIRNVVITYKDGNKLSISSEGTNINDSGMKLMANRTINQSVVNTSRIQR